MVDICGAEGGGGARGRVTRVLFCVGAPMHATLGATGHVTRRTAGHVTRGVAFDTPHLLIKYYNALKIIIPPPQRPTAHPCTSIQFTQSISKVLEVLEDRQSVAFLSKIS